MEGRRKIGIWISGSEREEGGRGKTHFEWAEFAEDLWGRLASERRRERETDLATDSAGRDWGADVAGEVVSGIQARWMEEHLATARPINRRLPSLCGEGGLATEFGESWKRGRTTPFTTAVRSAQIVPPVE